MVLSRRWRNLLFFAWVAALAVSAWISLMPASKLGNVPGWDKHWHFFSYVLLALPITPLCIHRPAILKTAALLVFFSFLLEIGQHFVPGRSMEMADLLANSLGVAAGVLLTGGWRPSPAAHAAPTGD